MILTVPTIDTAPKALYNSLFTQVRMTHLSTFSTLHDKHLVVGMNGKIWLSQDVVCWIIACFKISASKAVFFSISEKLNVHASSLWTHLWRCVLQKWRSLVQSLIRGYINRFGLEYWQAGETIQVLYFLPSLTLWSTLHLLAGACSPTHWRLWKHSFWQCFCWLHWPYSCDIAISQQGYFS